MSSKRVISGKVIDFIVISDDECTGSAEGSGKPGAERPLDVRAFKIEKADVYRD